MKGQWPFGLPLVKALISSTDRRAAYRADLLTHSFSVQFLRMQCWAQSKTRTSHGYRRQKLTPAECPRQEAGHRELKGDGAGWKKKEIGPRERKTLNCLWIVVLACLSPFVISIIYSLNFFLSVVSVWRSQLYQHRKFLIFLNNWQ